MSVLLEDMLRCDRHRHCSVIISTRGDRRVSCRVRVGVDQSGFPCSVVQLLGLHLDDNVDHDRDIRHFFKQSIR